MQWKILPKKSDDLIEQLLINRGIENKKDKEEFFYPDLANFKKDLQIPHIDKANKRILKAIETGELIIIYGDYDVDGICASAILYKGLTSLGAKVLPYIPHREKEGYGLSKQGLETAKAEGASVVITVDCGIVAFEQAKFAKNIGLDLIITDHHQRQDNLLDAFAIIHSTKMCGAAVAWCLIKEIIKKDLELDLLQFVAIATVCDLILLTGLGRAFVVEGLKVLNKTTNLGLLALINEAGIRLGQVSSYEIGHILGPRLNAIGRLEHAIDALRLLCTKDLVKAKRLAKLLSDTNIERQQMTTLALGQAKEMVDSKSKIHILSSQEWSVGIIGLIAGRITEEYFRPTIAISVGETIAKGSARSINGINIVELLRIHADLLIDVGGHPGAAGFSILSKHLGIFKKRVEKQAVNLADVEKVLQIDAQILTKQINKKLVQDLQKLAPFGFGNPRPIFASFNMQISDIRTVGEGKHLKFKADGIDCIAFGMGQLSQSLKNGQVINLAYTPELDTYNGFEKLQLKVRDIKLQN